jgi:hypothetical protein
MSLINVFLSPSKALIGVDTEGFCHKTGQYIPVGKMLHLLPANAILAGRGSAGFLFLLHQRLWAESISTGGANDFDSIVEVMPQMFADAFRAVEDGAQEVAGFDPFNQEIIFVGWSVSLNRMRAIEYARRGRRKDLQINEIEDPGYISPWDDKWGTAPEGETRQAMAKLSLAQTHNVKRESPQTAIGGQLMIAELTRFGMTFSAANELPAEIRKHEWVTFSADEVRDVRNAPQLEEKLKNIGSIKPIRQL